MEKKISFIKERVREIAEFKGVNYGDFFTSIEVSPTGFRGDKLKTGLNSDTIEKIISIYPDINIIWLLTGKGEMILTNTNQQQPTAPPTGDLEKDLVAKFANISPRDIAFYTHLKLDTMMEEDIFKALIENLATKRALELLKEK